MEFIEKIMTSRIGNYIIMITIVALFVGLLRLLYGPKGFLRKSLWNGIDDDENAEDDINMSNKKDDSNSHKNS